MLLRARSSRRQLSKVHGRHLIQRRSYFGVKTLASGLNSPSCKLPLKEPLNTKTSKRDAFNKASEDYMGFHKPAGAKMIICFKRSPPRELRSHISREVPRRLSRGDSCGV